jgi:HTH-type transcriptional regulator, transcriptional repressor of NAD biosynthesis genes
MTAAVARIRLLGAESTGKTTLAQDLAAAYGSLWNPEVGRPYTEIGRAPEAAWTSAEFTHIARLQCWYEDVLAEQATGVLFCDTDAFTTAVFHEVYLGHPTTAFDDLLDRPYDLTIVCGLDVPWRHDGIREFEAHRRDMHDRYVAHAQASGHPWLLVEGGPETRLSTAQAAVDVMLSTHRVTRGTGTLQPPPL